MGRTERQRKVIQMIVYKAKHAGLSKIFSIMDDVFPMVTTSLGNGIGLFLSAGVCCFVERNESVCYTRQQRKNELKLIVLQ